MQRGWTRVFRPCGSPIFCRLAPRACEIPPRPGDFWGGMTQENLFGHSWYSIPRVQTLWSGFMRPHNRRAEPLQHPEPRPAVSGPQCAHLQHGAHWPQTSLAGSQLDSGPHGWGGILGSQNPTAHPGPPPVKWPGLELVAVEGGGELCWESGPRDTELQDRGPDSPRSGERGGGSLSQIRGWEPIWTPQVGTVWGPKVSVLRPIPRQVVGAQGQGQAWPAGVQAPPPLGSAAGGRGGVFIIWRSQARAAHVAVARGLPRPRAARRARR